MDSGSTPDKSEKAFSEERIRQNHLDRVSRGTQGRREFLEAQARANAMEDTDPTPVEVPPFYTRPPTIREDLQRYVRYEVNRAAQTSGFETFEEADDFGDDIEDFDDLPDWDSEYELTPMQEENTMSYMDDTTGESDERQSETAQLRTASGEVDEGAGADGRTGTMVAEEGDRAQSRLREEEGFRQSGDKGAV